MTWLFLLACAPTPFEAASGSPSSPDTSVPSTMSEPSTSSPTPDTPTPPSGTDTGSHPATPSTDTEPTDTPTDTEPTDTPACLAYDSSEQEYAPIQTTGSGTPPGAGGVSWFAPTDWTYVAPFAGTPGYAAGHEGADYVHDDAGVPQVDVRAAAAGTVVYVRTGCDQSSLFGSNTTGRECGSGWGNHVVVDHGGGLATRYAHLLPDSVVVQVGDAVSARAVLAAMGNTGRSDVRHLHLELGTIGTPLDPCQPSQSFDAVFDPAGWVPGA